MGMRHAVLLIRDLLSCPAGPSILKASPPALSRLAEMGSTSIVSPAPVAAISQSKGAFANGTPEAAFLGLDPGSIDLQDGPLMVSALGADPPAGSVHFHLSLLSFDGARATTLKTRIPAEHTAAVISEAKKLNTKSLTLVPGEMLDHGLVWEDGSIELGTVPAAALDGNAIAGELPEGDGERILRRYIDDSINLLSDLPVNRQREDEGLPPLSLLWPWGQGFRTDVPNLALRRGSVCHVLSRSLRLQGLTRLVGYRHGDRSSMGYAVRLKPEVLKRFILDHDDSILVIEAFCEMREFGKWDEMEWLWREMGANLFEPLVDLSIKEPLQLSIIAFAGLDKPPGPEASETGLTLSFGSGTVSNGSIPFDERALEDRKLPTVRLWEAVQLGLEV